MIYREDLKRVMSYEEARIEALQKEVDRLKAENFAYERKVIHLEMQIESNKYRRND